MFWNYCMKCISNNVNNEYLYRDPMMHIEQHYTIYQQPTTTNIQSLSKTKSTPFLNKKINENRLKKKIKEINDQIITIKEESEEKTNHLSF